MESPVSEQALLQVAEAVRAACVRAALEGHERAGLSGLCGEGRWELALDSMQTLDLNAVVHAITSQHE